MAMHRRARFMTQHSSASTIIPPIVHLWLLRLLVPLGGHKNFISQHGFSNDSTAEFLGLGKWVDPEDESFSPKKVMVDLHKRNTQGERRLNAATTPEYLTANVARIAKLVGLSACECRILEFSTLIHHEPMLLECADSLGQLSSSKVFYVLSVLLGLAESDVRDALSPKGVLSRSALVSIDRTGHATLGEKLNLLSEHFADRMLSSDADPLDLIRDTVAKGSPAQLSIPDYEQISPSLDVLRPYLKRSIASGRKGVNVLMHGPPGTGKSQLAKVLAEELRCELFEVANESENGDAVDAERRLRAFRAAQSFFAQRQSLIVFDEAEDIFDGGQNFFFKRSTAQTRKAWLNRSLEENAVPTFWLTNSIDSLDAALIRRFDMVLELTVPPRKQRERILLESCAGLLEPSAVARLADSEALAPAVVTRAASVVRSIQDELGSDRTAAAFELLIRNTLIAQGHQPIRYNDPNRLPEVYDPMFIQADADLTEVAAGLIQAKSGRLCLYGPPGTGKTAFGRWLAEQMDLPLMVKRASDLMGKYVGETEKRIALAFREAEQGGALLLIDEVDSFLQDRRNAQRNWEVTHVNEMLTQIESFSGVFIASTNLMSGLDQAALRRFDLKVKFDFLNPQQSCELLQRHCLALSFPLPGSNEKSRMKHLKVLTPGDFAAVMRQHRFRPLKCVAELISALEAECRVKGGAPAPIGFIH